MANSESKQLAPWQAMSMLFLGIAIIFFGLMTLKVNARIVLAVDGAIMCLMACAFGISYNEIQKGIKEYDRLNAGSNVNSVISRRLNRCLDGFRYHPGYDLLRHEGYYS